jgi:hypothetical protein
MPYHFTCRQCGAAFTRPESAPAKYCSYACSNLGRRCRVLSTCAHCGKEREVIAVHAADPTRRFCSRACKVAATKTATAIGRRFWDKVQQGTGCWEWTGMLRRGRDESTIYAHRLSYELNIAPVPAGLIVCHRCDNPPCVRPEHLFLGTDNDNQRDKVAKGRQERGETHHAAKLTAADVVEIRSSRAQGTRVNELAAKYGVDRGAIQAVVSRKTWAHVP